MPEFELAPPWIIFARKVECMFAMDPEVHFQYNHNDNVISLYVDNPQKAMALEKILPETKSFGNVDVFIDVIPANKDYSQTDFFRFAFNGNPALNEIIGGVDGLFKFDYCVFNPDVVQYPSDDTSSYYGITTTIYEDIAEDIFEDRDGIFFCTAPKGVNK